MKKHCRNVEKGFLLLVPFNEESIEKVMKTFLTHSLATLTVSPFPQGSTLNSNVKSKQCISQKSQRSPKTTQTKHVCIAVASTIREKKFSMPVVSHWRRARGNISKDQQRDNKPTLSFLKSPFLCHDREKQIYSRPELASGDKKGAKLCWHETLSS